MSLFNWFGKNKGAIKNDSPGNAQSHSSSEPRQHHDKVSPVAIKSDTPATTQLLDRKLQRHARREQLYVAIRECMTRAGVLSASYKFKVLSLDQRGDQFLVMMDVAPGLGSQADKLCDIEMLLVSTAKSLFSIYVTAVYWRSDNTPVGVQAVNAVNFGVKQPAALGTQPAHPEAERPHVKQPGLPPYDPIHDDEMAAFKRALAAASAHHSLTPDGTAKSRRGLRSSTLVTGFEDTEMTDSPATPALSTTQYGELR